MLLWNPAGLVSGPRASDRGGIWPQGGIASGRGDECQRTGSEGPHRGVTARAPESRQSSRACRVRDHQRPSRCASHWWCIYVPRSQRITMVTVCDSRFGPGRPDRTDLGAVSPWHVSFGA